MQFLQVYIFYITKSIKKEAKTMGHFGISRAHQPQPTVHVKNIFCGALPRSAFQPLFQFNAWQPYSDGLSGGEKYAHAALTAFRALFTGKDSSRSTLENIGTYGAMANMGLYGGMYGLGGYGYPYGGYPEGSLGADVNTQAAVSIGSGLGMIGNTLAKFGLFGKKAAQLTGAASVSAPQTKTESTDDIKNLNNMFSAQGWKFSYTGGQICAVNSKTGAKLTAANAKEMFDLIPETAPSVTPARTTTTTTTGTDAAEA